MQPRAPGPPVAPDDSDPVLVARIREAIEAAPGRRITFARFMEQALTEPGLGYYATSATRPTRSGDFLTAPELHPWFGRCIGRALSGMWQRMGGSSGWVVREWGAGQGTLGRTVLEGLRADDDQLAAAIDWQPVDVPGRHPEPPQAPFSGVVLANEYLDALPVHRLVVRDGRLLERYVTWTRGWFAEQAGEPSTHDLTDPVRAAGVTLTEGQQVEVRPAAAAWLRGVAASLTRGVVLVIDYGHTAPELYSPTRMAGTLVTYRGHTAGDDPFVAVGRQDITAHVDLSELGRAAADLGLDTLGSTDQARFLAGLGMGELLYRFGRDPATPAPDYVTARASIARLLDPRHLGAFRVLAFGRGVVGVPALPGFVQA